MFTILLQYEDMLTFAEKDSTSVLPDVSYDVFYLGSFSLSASSLYRQKDEYTLKSLKANRDLWFLEIDLLAIWVDSMRRFERWNWGCCTSFGLLVADIKFLTTTVGKLGYGFFLWFMIFFLQKG